jgi:hypothetical protein
MLTQSFGSGDQRDMDMDFEDQGLSGTSSPHLQRGDGSCPTNIWPQQWLRVDTVKSEPVTGQMALTEERSPHIPQWTAK